jgi:acyl dehydratase
MTAPEDRHQMPLNIRELLDRRLRIETTYGDREVMLYAISLGLGRDPLDAAALKFVYEDALQVIPTFATILSFSARLMRPTDGLDVGKLLHGEQRLVLHRPLPPQGTVVIDARIKEIIDKGPGKGLLIIQEIIVSLKETGERLATVEGTGFYRADGGRAGTTGSAPAPHAIPDRVPDAEVAMETRPEQALLYRLNGDRNPLHAAPAFAIRSGFDRPILHGLCTYGIACCAVAQTYCPDGPGMIRTFDVRFSAPVFPGETILTQMWRDGSTISYRSIAQDRQVVVLNNGKCTLG